MKLPWRAARQTQRLALSLSAEHFAYVLADQVPTDAAQGPPVRVLRWGLERRQPEVSATDFQRHLRGLGLSAGQTVALLGHDHYQILKIETPAVPQDELKAAARWQIKEMVDAHLDDLTLDVMHVGDDRPRAHKHLFVVAAANSALRELTEGCQHIGLPLSAVDIWETAQRNVQTAAAQAAGLQERATAALVLHQHECLLTLSAHGELFYTRRLDWDERLRQRALGQVLPQAPAVQALGFEYMPGDDLGYGPEAGADADADGSPLVIEMQRSIDVWERSWPDLPLAQLSLATPEHSKELASLMQRELGLRTQAMDLSALFNGFELKPGDPLQGLDAYAACLPLLGALLRTETRKP